MSEKMNADAPLDESKKQPKHTGLLSNIEADQSDVSSSRRLDFALAVESVTDTYPDVNHMLMVYFPQKAEPIIFKEPDTILIGRTGGRAPVNLDTTNFHGRELGVSRQHAEIVYDNDTFYVRDLKSTNGTWLNTERLDPVKRYRVNAGDQLRLGQCLMILYVR